MLFTEKGKTILVESVDSIPLFALSIDETKIYYTLFKSIPPEHVRKDAEEGHVFDPTYEFLFSIVTHKTPPTDLEEIRSFDLITGKSDLITHLSHKKKWFSHLGGRIQALHVSKNGEYLLMSIFQLGQPDLGSTGIQMDVKVWDLASERWYVPLKDPVNIETTPQWIDEKKFVFQQY